MKKNIFKVLIIILIILIIVGVGIFFVMKYLKDNQYADIQNYTPQEEISDEQLRKTIVSLYFKDSEKDELVTEARLIDAKLLINEPYTLLLTMLIQGPQNEKNKGLIPSNTIINNIQLNGDTLDIDLSEAFIKEFEGNDKQKKLAIHSILNTLTQLNEVNKIRILINGEKDKGFENSEVNFKDVFVREGQV